MTWLLGVLSLVFLILAIIPTALAQEYIDDARDWVRFWGLFGLALALWIIGVALLAVALTS